MALSEESFLPDEEGCAETWRALRWLDGPECVEYGSSDVTVQDWDYLSLLHGQTERLPPGRENQRFWRGACHSVSPHQASRLQDAHIERRDGSTGPEHHEPFKTIRAHHQETGTEANAVGHTVQSILDTSYREGQ